MTGAVETARAARAAFGAFTALAALSCASPSEPAPPVALEIVQLAAGAASGAPFSTQPIIHVVDANGRRVRSGQHSITMTVAGGGSGIVGTSTIGSVEGIAAFWDVGVTGAAGVTYSLTFTAVGLETALQSIIASAGAASELALITPGAGATSGAAFANQPVIEVRDAQGNRRLQDDATVVTATVASGTLTGAVTATAVDGRASFTSLGLIGLVGDYTLSFEAPSLAPIAQQIELAVGPPVSLTIVRAAVDGTNDDPFTVQPQVAVLDAGGNRLSANSGTVVTFGVGGGATVTGAATATTVAGVATFADVGVAGTPGQSHSVTYSAPGLEGVAGSVYVGAGDWDVVAAGTDLNCGVHTTGTTHCWGAGSDEPPPPLTGAPMFSSVSLGYWRKCGRTGAGEAWCWGIPTPIPGGVQLSQVPTLVPGSHVFTQVVAMSNAACGLTGTGAAYCWGGNENSELGDGTSTASETPVAVQGDHVFESLAAGAAHACGLKADGTAHCWGANGSGQLGDGSTNLASSPVAVSGGHQFLTLALGSNVSCGITVAGPTLCWGNSTYAGIGVSEGQTTEEPTPIVGGHEFASISVGNRSSCGVTHAGQAWCWGDNEWGQLANGTVESTNAPTASLPGRVFTSISVGAAHACGRSTSGAGLCWGLGFTKFYADPANDPPRAPAAVVRP